MNLKTLTTAVALGGAMTLSSSAFAALSFSDDFEARNAADPAALADYGFGNVIVAGGGGAFFSGVNAPNNTADGLNGYSRIESGQGGPAQGQQQLAVYSDYNGFGPFATQPGDQTVDTFVFHDIGNFSAADANVTYTFTFDAKEGDINTSDPANPSSAFAYINVLQTSNGSFATLFNQEIETTNVGPDWQTLSISVTVDAAWAAAGELLQVGFRNNTFEFQPSTVFYDNINVQAVPVPAAAWLFGSALVGLFAARRK